MSLALVHWIERPATFCTIVQGGWAPDAKQTLEKLSLALAAMVALLILASVYSARKGRQRWALLGSVFDAGAEATRTRKATGHFHGRETVLFSDGGRRLFFFHAQIACSSRLIFKVDPRGGIEIGKARNSFEIGDPKLDQGFNFTCNDADRFRSWFFKPENNRTLMPLLEQGARRCRLEADGMRLAWRIQGTLATAVFVGSKGPEGWAVRRTDKETRLPQELDSIRGVLEDLTQLAVRLEGSHWGDAA
jgi:hypothetical protein